MAEEDHPAVSCSAAQALTAEEAVDLYRGTGGRQPRRATTRPRRVGERSRPPTGRRVPPVEGLAASEGAVNVYQELTAGAPHLYDLRAERAGELVAILRRQEA